jgi:hypothetical protein
VITQAGNAENVKGLVYLSALVPDSGESVTDTLTRLNAPMSGMQPDNNGLIRGYSPFIDVSRCVRRYPLPTLFLLT